MIIGECTWTIRFIGIIGISNLSKTNLFLSTWINITNFQLDLRNKRWFAENLAQQEFKSNLNFLKETQTEQENKMWSESYSFPYFVTVHCWLWSLNVIVFTVMIVFEWMAETYRNSYLRMSWKSETML